MDNKKILRFGTIAAVVLIVLFGITVLIDDTRGFRKVDTSVAMAQLNDNNVKEVQIDDREQRLRLTLKNGINVDKRDGVTEIIAEYPARSAPVIFDKVQASNPEKYTTKVNRENFFTSMLGMLLPIVMSFLSQRFLQGGNGTQQLDQALANERQQLNNQGAGSALSSLLDQNGDGKLDMNDLVKLGSSLLGGKR